MGRELYALDVAAYRDSERFRKAGLAGSGDIVEQDVSPRKKRGNYKPNLLRLAVYDLFDIYKYAVRERLDIHCCIPLSDFMVK